MFKNKEINRLFKLELIIIIISTILFLLINNYNYELYKQELINNNAYIINGIIEKYPNLENDVIELMLNQDISKKESTQILEKYGIDNLDTIDYLNKNKKLKNTIFLINFTYIFLTISIIVTIFILTIKKIYKKINNLSKYTNEILNDNYSMDIREYEEGDISNLKNDLYKMTIKLKEQNDISLNDKKRLRETLSDISHQLKTPLTSMYVINELLYEELEENKKNELLNRNQNSLERIEWLVTSLLKISRLDSGMEVLKQENIKIIDLINKSLDQIKIPLELKNINVLVNCKEDIKYKLDLAWTSEALINILKNAYEHTKKDGEIIINVIENPIYVEIIITDNGCGISKEDLPHIFERFYKGKSNKESIGIGLNMALKIVNLQKGDITVTSKVNEGTAFKIRFYKNVI